MQIGGPLLTFAVLAAALGVSYARRRDERLRRKQREQQQSQDATAALDGAALPMQGSGKYFSVLSAEAIKLLVGADRRHQ